MGAHDLVDQIQLPRVINHHGHPCREIFAGGKPREGRTVDTRVRDDDVVDASLALREPERLGQGVCQHAAVPRQREHCVEHCSRTH